MRKVALLVATVAALAVPAAAAQAAGEVTDVLAAPSVAGALTITGLGLGSLTAPSNTGNQTVGAVSSAIAGSQLTVTDATGSTAGWDVTATYGALTPTQLDGLTLPVGVASAADIGAANVTVAAATTSTLATANGTLGVANPVLASATSLASPVQVSRSGGDGRGVTVFNTGYTITLPAKTTAVATLYTGKIVYTVAPPVS